MNNIINTRRKNFIWIILIFFTTASCTGNNTNSEVLVSLKNQYNNLSVFQKELDKEQHKFELKKDSLIEELRITHGVLNTSIDVYNEKLKENIEKHRIYTIQHNSILERLAQLQDELNNDIISEKEALKEKDDLYEQHLTLKKNYNIFTKEKEKLLKVDSAFIEETSPLIP